MSNKYSDEKHMALSNSIFSISKEMHKIKILVYEDKELLEDLQNAARCFKDFSRKMQER
jgi:hypothetical protein